MRHSPRPAPTERATLCRELRRIEERFVTDALRKYVTQAACEVFWDQAARAPIMSELRHDVCDAT